MNNLWKARINLVLLSVLTGMLTHNYYDEVHYIKQHEDHAIDLAREARQHRDESSDNDTAEFFAEALMLSRPKEES